MIGVQPSGISHILSGRNKPSLDFVLKMLERYPFISTEWLLFGKGSMYSEPS
ncbi:MAG: helix-turn-helix transcriptional regulator, partial [Bacteroidota bacterium]|nr:helix-turn-helix transcriptional regulator [Bacteroidota bacterium]